MQALDVFSGIGGFSVALRGAFRTVGYCEIDEPCRAVLQRNIRRGRLERAAIHDDVRTLRSADVHERVDLVTAGFPCQDISTLNRKRTGLQGARSGLFYDLMEWVKQRRDVRYVLLENSPDIRTNGLDAVLACLRDCGFTHIAYGYFTAAELGAPHVRKRWYCLAARSAAAAARLPALPERPAFDWADARPQKRRLVPRTAETHKANIGRCAMLGNSVVPDVVAHAYRTLRSALVTTVAPGRAPRDVSITVVRPSGTVTFARPVAKWPDVPVTMADGKGTTFTRGHWMTPVRKNWEQYRVLTPRACWLLPNQIFYSTTTTEADPNVPIHMRSWHYDINPRFVEYLMGYSADWTKA
jgi:DNA (cytosine-5)-methyltransferase 1